MFPLHGALIAILGDMMQITRNDKFKSVVHKVLANKLADNISYGEFTEYYMSKLVQEMEDADCDEREMEVVEGLDETKAGVEGLDCDECEKEVKRLDDTKAGVKGLDCDEREKEVKEFDETKAGVKGLVDSGVTKIPSIFLHSPEGHKIQLCRITKMASIKYSKFRSLISTVSKRARGEKKSLET
ncbi:hypothetical protein M0R45_010664 [Rubus argutus]|uniref:Uncharacterized protein n=1 Tax=Rubus argutus TaxID=59490 RepID=A0AAW1YA99_RUBAR